MARAPIALPLLLIALAAPLGCGDTDTETEPDDGTGDTDTADDDLCDEIIACDLGTYEGSFQIETQADLAEIAGYTAVEGSLGIRCSTCPNLCGLECLTSVGGYLHIGGEAGDYEVEPCLSSSALQNLDGLSNLTTIGEGLSLTCLTDLPHVDALGNLATPLGTRLRIMANKSLTNLNGLSGIGPIDGWLSVLIRPPYCFTPRQVRDEFSVRDLMLLNLVTETGPA